MMTLTKSMGDCSFENEQIWQKPVLKPVACTDCHIKIII